MIGLVAKLSRNLAVSGEHLGRSMNLLPVAGVVSSNLRCLRPAETAPRNGFLDLLAAGTGGFQVLSGVALYVGRTALASLDLVAQIAEPEREFRLINGGRKLLAIEVTLRLKCASRTVGSLGHIEDDGMGMELGRGVAVNRAGGVMLELRDDKLARRFGGLVPADACLGVTLQLSKGDGHGLPMGLPDTVIAAYQSG